MNKTKNFFTKFPVILPVIHVQNAAQALSNARIALDNGCPGIFLINHRIPYEQLLHAHMLVRAEYPHAWIGLNFLDLDAYLIFERIPLDDIQGVWVDNPEIKEFSKDQSVAELISKKINEINWKGLYFGGVAFKHQSPVHDLKNMAALACHYMDVVTTSGPATGFPPDTEKIRTMKKAIGNKPLAIASGITPENAHLFMPYTDFFLVATGISRDFHNLDPQKLQLLMTKCRK